MPTIGFVAPRLGDAAIVPLFDFQGAAEQCEQQRQGRNSALRKTRQRFEVPGGRRRRKGRGRTHTGRMCSEHWCNGQQGVGHTGGCGRP